MKPSAQGTLLIDFDSTLIACESLEVILASQIGDDETTMNQIRRITTLGMAGTLSFGDSLTKRLQLATPTLASE